jgi:hypothetical protein
MIARQFALNGMVINLLCAPPFSWQFSWRSICCADRHRRRRRFAASSACSFRETSSFLRLLVGAACRVPGRLWCWNVEEARRSQQTTSHL